ncbi:hypothetical protein CK503_04030 [Aliifodinibius salipaludis]|uniref:DUF91 domain-containing protein n=1 Tax=Fodinibius salipaludis TaxID=2032627 RepID=A0A2A2GCT5_9BACT|nr:hypothetical protein [Aliifodinibius salipaludis]PAU95371.1 hypothetical protein CK503_04030 [Aliifodinibius salipaludis]
MPTGIFLINKKNELVELEETDFQSEDIFQELLENYPNLLSGKLIDPEVPRSWLLVDREVGIPGEEKGGGRWSLDHLFLDQDGIPTLVEVKRSSDTRIRREVVGQMLDYAANAITYWPVEQIISVLENRCETQNEDPVQLIKNLFDAEYETYWDRVKTNLTAGKVRMIFLADKIPIELKRIVEFLNEQMDPAEVLALEIRQFKADGLQTLVPRLYGNTSDAEKRKSTSYSKREPWTKETFFEELRKNVSQEQVDLAKQIFAWAENTCDQLGYGRGKTMGSMIPVIEKDGKEHYPFAVWTTGYVELYFQWHSYKKPFDSEELRLEMLEKFKQIKGISLNKDDINKRPSVQFNILQQGDNLEKFFEIHEWFIKQLHN